MQKLEVNIFGSCATRDPLTHFPDEIAVKKYSARASLVSLIAPDLDVVIPIREGQNKFLTRVTDEDITKFWRKNRPFPDLPEVYDFVDERNGLLNIGGSYITNSGALKHVVADFDDFMKTCRVIETTSPEFRELVEANIDAFCARLDERGDIIINQCYWSEVDENNQGFSEKEKKLTVAMNSILEFIYENISKKTNARFFGLSPDEYIARSDHRWGRSPFHWSIETEKKIGAALIDLLRSGS